MVADGVRYPVTNPRYQNLYIIFCNSSIYLIVEKLPSTPVDANADYGDLG